MQAMRDLAIDFVHLARQTEGDEALKAELLALFERQAARALQKLADPALPEGARADLAHRLKGSALAIGAGRVAAAAEAVEIASGSREWTPAILALSLAVAEACAAITFRD
jgi:HPt (histidine-containing phosphotransfer) domain-containing protein